jgi:hypothetical protein
VDRAVKPHIQENPLGGLNAHPLARTRHDHSIRACECMLVVNVDNLAASVGRLSTFGLCMICDVMLLMMLVWQDGQGWFSK